MRCPTAHNTPAALSLPATISGAVGAAQHCVVVRFYAFPALTLIFSEFVHLKNTCTNVHKSRSALRHKTVFRLALTQKTVI